MKKQSLISGWFFYVHLDLGYPQKTTELLCHSISSIAFIFISSCWKITSLSWSVWFSIDTNESFPANLNGLLRHNHIIIHRNKEVQKNITSPPNLKPTQNPQKTNSVSHHLQSENWRLGNRWHLKVEWIEIEGTKWG